MTTEATRDRIRLLEQHTDDARRAFTSRNDGLRGLGHPDDPAMVVLVIDCSCSEGERIAKQLTGREAHRLWCDICRQRGDIPVLCVGAGRETAIALLGPDAEARLHRSAPSGEFTTVVVAYGGMTVTSMPVAGRNGGFTFNTSPVFLTHWTPPTDYSTSA